MRNLFWGILFLIGITIGTDAWAVTAPSTLRASVVSSSQINLSYRDRSSSETGFIIERSLSASSGFSEIARVGRNVVSYSNVGLAQNTTYYYRVRSYRVRTSSTEYSTYTSVVSAKTLASAPSFSIVSGPSAINVTASTVQITWSLSQNGTGQVEYGTTTSYGKLSTLESSFNYSSHVQTISGLSAGTLYHYRVISRNSSGVQVVSTDRTFTTTGAVSYTYSWSSSAWSACSATACGTQGTQSRTVECKRNDNVTVADSYCSNAGAKPATSQSCSAPACQAQSCALPWGGTIASGSSVTAYAAASVPNGQTCSSQSRSCNNGVLSGSYTFQACTVEPPVSGEAPVSIIVVPSFETAGVYITLPSGAASTVSAKLFVKKQSESSFKEAHFFTRYDQNNMASSLFDLAGGTAYEIQVQYTDASGTKSKNAFFTTRNDSAALPAATRTVNVSTAAQLSSAISAAVPGDHIVLAPGTYSSISISKKGTASAPIVIRGSQEFDQFNPGSSSRAIIQASGADGVYFSNAAYVILDNVEVKGGSNSAVYLRNSSRVTVQNSYIHDGGSYDILISKGNEYTTDINQAGYYVIQNNNITDPDGIAGCPQGNDGCSKVTYYGVHINNKGGAGTVIRNNRVAGHVDNITPCGDEGSARTLAENTAHVLRMTNAAGVWLNHDTEVYGNEVYDSLDDDIETDGICVNLRVHKNVTGKTGTDLAYIPMNAITIAPVSPGPIFIVRNIIKNYEESAFKMNTAGGSIPTRNIYIYHNTIVKPVTTYALINLWYAVPGDHDVPVKNIHFRNNIFSAPNGGKCIDAYNQGTTHPTFDFNLWYSTSSSSSLFEWYNGGNRSASNIAGFRTISGQETNGLFGNPLLDSNFNLTSSSPAIDKGGRLPGINDNYKGVAPDIGAVEF